MKTRREVITAIPYIIIGTIPFDLLYLLMRPELAKATVATWREALLFAVLIIGFCAAMAVKESVDERTKPKHFSSLQAAINSVPAYLNRSVTFEKQLDGNYVVLYGRVARR